MIPGIDLLGDIPRLCADGGVEISSGITPGHAQCTEFTFDHDAFVPRLPWRKPDEAAAAVLCGASGMVTPGRWLQHWRVPATVFDRFADLRDASKRYTEDMSEEWIRRTYSADIAEAAAYAKTLLRPGSVAEDGHLFFRPSGLPTTAKYPALLGLHIDTSCTAPMAMRPYSPNRLSVNLGCDDRFLLFVNLDLTQIDGLLKHEGVAYQGATSAWTHGLRTAFMSHCAGYPVVKLRVRPGEAYIAPTENIIHDGCTTGQRFRDIQFSVRGVFQPLDALRNVEMNSVN